MRRIVVILSDDVKGVSRKEVFPYRNSFFQKTDSIVGGDHYDDERKNKWCGFGSGKKAGSRRRRRFSFRT